MPTGIVTAFEFMLDSVVDMIAIVTSDATLSLAIAMWIIGGTIGLFKRLV